MGHWGVRSYENDEAADALDAGFARVHGATYDDLMEDDNPLSPEQVQERLANPETLLAALSALTEAAEGRPVDDRDEVERLAFTGVVVRHAELGVAIPADVRALALACLKDEPIEWEEATARRLRREAEVRRIESSA